MELTKLKVELNNKKSTIDKSKETLCSKLECTLFEVKKEDYLVNGQRNWSLLRKHVFVLQQYCKRHLGGRLPAKQDISEILESALSEDTSSSLGYYRAKQTQSGKRKRENPFKPHLEKYGIQFPDKSDKCSSSLCEKSRDKKTYNFVHYGNRTRIRVSGKQAVGNGYKGKSAKHATSEYLAQFGTKCVSYLSSDTGAHTWKLPGASDASISNAYVNEHVSKLAIHATLFSSC